ncbi:MAG TPA: transposase zinc-binding domain-containing protein [Symbiobacteriaceae bacterium]|nr:transposase zinc-binding domain-containing protein [Symbiobacteriaceae bacterium]
MGFTCKSRFCPRCGKRYVDQWVEKQVETILNVSHRHTVFTIPEAQCPKNMIKPDATAT